MCRHVLFGLNWSLSAFKLSAFHLASLLSTGCLPCRDVGRVLHVVFGSSIPGPVVLVGHSMGGAIAVHTEFKQCLGEHECPWKPFACTSSTCVELIFLIFYINFHENGWLTIANQ